MAEPLSHFLRRKSTEIGLLGIGGAGRARVLMYHGVGEEGCHRVNVRHLSARVFEHHLRLFKEHFHVVPLSDLFRGERHPAKLTVALTFDDGLRNNLTHALPLLEKYEVPASFFITGANPLGLRVLWGDLLDLSERHTARELTVSGKRWRKNTKGRYADPGSPGLDPGGSGMLLRDHIKQAGVWAPKAELYEQLISLVDQELRADRLFWELMTDEELRGFAQHPLVTIGGHGWWHNDMGHLPLEEAIEELRQSKAYLENLTGKPIDQLAWPDGSYSSATIAASAEMGFAQQLAVNYRSDQDRVNAQLLDRYGVYDFPVHDRWLLRLIAEGAV